MLDECDVSDTVMASAFSLMKVRSPFWAVIHTLAATLGGTPKEEREFPLLLPSMLGLEKKKHYFYFLLKLVLKLQNFHSFVVFHLNKILAYLNVLRVTYLLNFT